MATDTLTHATAHAHEHGHHDAGGTKIFGFWIYLMSDCILFSILFATYAVLVNGTAGGPTGKDIFEQNAVAHQVDPKSEDFGSACIVVPVFVRVGSRVRQSISCHFSALP